MYESIDDFIGLHRLAVVGVSERTYKYGYRVYHDLKARGYDVLPVNPRLEAFDDRPSYPALNTLPEPVDGAVIIIPPPNVPQVLREAAEAGIRYIWLQPGAESEEAIALAEELGLNLVHTACVMVEARRAGRAYV